MIHKKYTTSITKKKTEKRFLPSKIQTGILNTIVHTTLPIYYDNN